MAEATKINNVYVFEIQQTINNNVMSISERSYIDWHKAFVLLNKQSLRTIDNQQLVYGMAIKDGFSKTQCTTCSKYKISTTPIPNSTTTSTELLEIVHTDICGPMKNKTIGGCKYFIIFTDYKSRYVTVYFLKSKNEALSCFKKYKAMSELFRHRVPKQ